MTSEQNPFNQPDHEQNFTRHIRDQILCMGVGDSKFINSHGRSRAVFSATLSKCSDYKFSTKASKTGKDGYWVKRIR